MKNQKKSGVLLSYLTLRNLQRVSLNIRLNFLDDLGKCCVKHGLLQNSQIEFLNQYHV